MSKGIRPASALPAAFLLLAGCGLFLLPGPAGVETFPASENQIVGPGDSIRVSFGIEVDRPSVEALLAVLGGTGRVDGSCLWEGRSVTFVPEPPLTPGLRYVLSFNGVFESAEGVEHSAHLLLPFYYISRETTGPYVADSAPLPGETIGPADGLLLRFSRDLDPLTLADGLSLSPSTRHTVGWSDGTKELVLTPEERWEERTVYTLRCTRKLRDISGLPLVREHEVVFLVQEDVTPPVVVSVEAALDDPDLLYPALGADLDALLTVRGALRITFSEAMEAEATAGALAFTPALAGSRWWVDEHVLVFVPSTGYEPGTVYTLEIRDRAADAAGNRLQGFEPLTFTARVDFLEVTTELALDPPLIPPGGYSTAAARQITLGASGPHDYTLVFQLDGGVFDRDVEKLSAHQAIDISCLFPPGTPSPYPIGCTWTGHTRLNVTFTGFEPSGADRKVYYLLRIRGGPTGIRTDEGNVLAADLEQLLVAVAP